MKNYKLLAGLGTAYFVWKAYHDGYIHFPEQKKPKQKTLNHQKFILLMSFMILIVIYIKGFIEACTNIVDSCKKIVNDLKVKCNVEAIISSDNVSKQVNCQFDYCLPNNKSEENNNNYYNAQNDNNIYNDTNDKNVNISNTKAIKISSDSLSNDNVVIYKVIANIDDDLPNILNNEEINEDTPKIKINKLNKIGNYKNQKRKQRKLGKLINVTKKDEKKKQVKIVDVDENDMINNSKVDTKTEIEKEVDSKE